MMISNTQSNLVKLISGISGVRTGNFEEERKRSVMAVFLLIGIVVLIPFAAHHFMLGNIARAILLLLVGSTQLFSLVALRFIGHATGIYRLNVILLGVYFLFLVNVGGQHGSRILWVFIFPLLAFFMLGKKEGLFWCALQFLLSVILIADPGSAFDTFPYEREIKSRFFVVYGIIVTMSYVVEAARGRYYTGMERNQISLEKEIKERRRLEEIAAAESSVRRQAEEDLQKAYDDLESRISERTSELRKVNERLRFEIKERQSAEGDLRSSERRLADIINFLPDATFVVDLDGKVIAWNQAIEELTNIPAEKMLGRGNYEYGIAFYGTRRPVMIDLALNWDEKTARQYEYVKRDGATLVSETRNPSFRKDPSLFWNTASPLYDANGAIVGAIEVIRDITERMLAEEALQEAYNILNLSPAVAFLWQNADGWPVQFVTDNVEKLFGYKADDFLSQYVDYEKTIHPEDLERVAQEVAKFSAEKGRLTFRHQPYRIITADEAVKWVDDRTYIRRNENDEISHYQGIVMDITDQMLMQAALRESEERFRELSDLLPEIIYEMDKEARLTFVNRRAIQQFGYSRKEFENGLKAFDMIIPPERQRAADAMAKILKGQEAGLNEYTALRKDGTTFPIMIRSAPLLRDGQLIGMRGVIIDMSGKKRLESQLIQAQKMEAIGTLAGGIAHDFNNIMMGIQGRTSLMLLDVPTGHPHYEHLTSIQDYVKSAAELTKQLLGFARGGKYQVKPTDIKRLVVDTAGLFGRTKKEIRIHHKHPEDIWTVVVDQTQIEQVLLNLYVNAWQAMPGGGELYLQIENVNLSEDQVEPCDAKPGRYVEITVTDTGIGMDEKTQRRIFDPFFTTKDMARGTGLGLASAYGIMRSHNGFIKVSSAYGKGSTFQIYLPASDQKIQSEMGERQEIFKGRETLLIVDDEWMIVDIGKKMLERLGYEVLTALSGKEAIDVYQRLRQRIQLVVLDLVMPEMGGRQVFERLKEINPKLKVLLASGYSLEGEAKEMMARGCDGFIQKPFNMHKLSRKLRSILEGH